MDTCYRHPDRETGLRCSNCERPICPDCSIDATFGQRCPECHRSIGTTRSRNLKTLSPADGAVVTKALIAIAVAVYVAGRFVPESNRWLAELVQDNRLVTDGQWWRIFGAALLHAGTLHLGFNMYALYLFGPAIERRYGPGPFLALYAAAAASGGAVAYHLGGPNDRLVGASGAIFGIFGVWLYLSAKHRDTRQGRAMYNQMLFLLALNAAIPLLVREISWQGHLGGLLAGLLLGWAYEKVQTDQTVRRLAVAAALTLAAVLSVW